MSSAFLMSMMFPHGYGIVLQDKHGSPSGFRIPTVSAQLFLALFSALRSPPSDLRAVPTAELRAVPVSEARRQPPGFLRRRESVILVAIISALAIWWAWGAFDPIPLVQDETSY